MGFWDGDTWRWNVPWKRQLRARDILEWQELDTLLKKAVMDPLSKDRLIWCLEISGKFSVKAFYLELSKNYLSYLQNAAHKLWRGLVPFRMEVFL